MYYLLAFIQVVDWKIIDGGRQLYKVEWHATWEPAEALATCQHLVDEFWTLVNKTKQNEVGDGLGIFYRSIDLSVSPMVLI